MTKCRGHLHKTISATSLLLLITLTFGSGCSTPVKKQGPNTTPLEEKAGFQTEQGLAQTLKKVAAGIEGVEESSVVVVNKEAAVGIKITGFDRLHIKRIKNNVEKAVKNTAKGYSVRVTPDKKLFAQLKILEKAETPVAEEAEKELFQRWEKIKKDMDQK